MKNNKRAAKKLSSVISLMVVLALVINAGTIYRTGVIKGLNPSVDGKAAWIINNEQEKATYPGYFIDRNGYEITSHEEKGVKPKATHDTAYSFIVGYNSNIYGRCALNQQYSDILYKGNKDEYGAIIQLTLDAPLQIYLDRIINNHKGSIVVLDGESGEVLAMVGRSDKLKSFCINDIDSQYKEYKKIDEFFVNPAMKMDSPGSTFKMVTAAAMLQHGLEDYMYNDSTGTYTAGTMTLHNYTPTPFNETDLQKALTYSVNTYFASAGVALGGQKLTDTAERFMLNKSIETDFGTINSVFKIDASNYLESLAQNAYGQGFKLETLSISPIQIAMITQAIMADGVMMKPYMVKSISDDNKIKEVNEPEKLSVAMNKSDAMKLKEYLHNVASSSSYHFSEDKHGYVISKTGTAIVGKNENGTKMYHKYLAFGIQTHNKKYAVCIDFDSLQEDEDLKKTGNQIAEYLNTYSLQN